MDGGFFFSLWQGVHLLSSTGLTSRWKLIGSRPPPSGVIFDGARRSAVARGYSGLRVLHVPS